MASSKTRQLRKTNTAPIASIALSGLSASSASSAKIAVAFSGGLDSTVLLHSTVAAYGNENVIALHVNHGLQLHSNDWNAHCAQVAKDFDIEFDSRTIAWASDSLPQANIEARARTARYAALVEMLSVHEIEHLLLAHHQDDQAETVLLQLLRGAGLPGLSAMPSIKELESGLVRVWRPFLELTRAELESYAAQYQLEWIEDPSNQDEKFTRNLIRKKLMPLIEKIQPQFRANLSRSAQHLSSAQRLLDQLAEIDLNGMSSAAGLNMYQLLILRDQDGDRASNALRRWLALQDLMMPSQERLNAWWRDAENLKSLVDHRLSWEHDGKYLRVWREHLSVVDTQHHGHWVFSLIEDETLADGLAAPDYENALLNGQLKERVRQGGDKMRRTPKTPRKTLKNLFQEMAIPPWQRSAPVLCLGNEVLAVAGIGMNTDFCVTMGPRWMAQWQVD